MFFLMRCDHHPGMDGARDRLRPAHRDWNRSGGAGRVSVIHGSALWDDAGVAIGHWGLIEAATPEAARAYLDGDPFVTGGVVATIALTRLADSFAADRISPRMTV
ncbi:MAG: hypothetical protein H6900_13880 [Rhodobacter sp.]|uniref:YciI family protein n=1 Tax=Pararhodobacter sp. TaxID=2127056 RepID=UPI001DDDE25E|nr:YciI family protein [Pararhodobacter sp.]MCB1344584.1 hypothetical protein [Paracoccaceae bacterium]MCC0074369.1 hypothetical protein [Rhodobacter sp.]HPD91253.1 YciI family protein [Pararhodobacter sp.]